MLKTNAWCDILVRREIFSSNIVMAKRHKNTRRRHKKFKLNNQTLYTIVAVLLFGAAGLILLSFGQQGELLTKLYEMLYEKIGAGTYFLPFDLIAFGFLIIGSKTFLSKPNLAIGLSIATFSLIAIGQMGTIGEEIWFQVATLLSPAGGAIVFLGALIIGVVIFFNTSLDRLLNLSGNLIGVVASAFKSSDSARIKNGKPIKEEKKPLFAFDKLPLRVKGSGVDVKEGAKPNTSVPATTGQMVVKTPPKTATNLGSELVLNTPKAPGINLWEYPAIALLENLGKSKADRGDLKKNAAIIERTLDSFGIAARVVEVNLGPAVTQYALEIALGTKVSKITSLANDLALALAAPTGQIRIEAPIPGRNLVGIEIPNRSLEFVTLKQMLQSDNMRTSKSKLSVALGLDVSGNPVVANIAKMPHILIAGTTGSGKSVLVNAIICSLLFRATPDEVKVILVDPKRVELVGYNGIPHLLTPVIVIIIDELADLMAYAPVEVEDAICRLAQMARATGIHLVIATQRPSVDVITGLIKANIPSRIAFNVSSMIDSRVILDTPGAEKLLGRGDMLYIPPDQAKPARIQGTFVSEAEVQKLVAFLKSKNPPVQYTEEVTSMPVSSWKKSGGGGSDGRDELFEEAVRTVCQYDRASASLLQRRLSIGYARAARILDQLEQAGIVGPGEGSKPRDVLVRNAEEYFAQQQGEQVSTNQVQ